MSNTKKTCKNALAKVSNAEGIKAMKEQFKKSGLKLSDKQVKNMINMPDFRKEFMVQCEKTMKMAGSLLKLLKKNSTKKVKR